MTKSQFLSRLKRRLRSLPPDEYEDAVAFYEEYFAEAADDKQAVVKLGSPESVAAKILADYAADTSKPNPGLKLWLIILALFAAPIAFPLAIALLAVIFALFISLFAVTFSLLAAGVGVLIGGLATVLFSVPLFAANPMSTVFFVGSGLICVSLGIVLCSFSIWLIKISLSAFIALCSKIVRKSL